MDLNEFYREKNFIIDNKTAADRNRESVYSDLTSAISGNKNISDNYLKQKLMEIETHNAYLENIITQQKQELADTVSTNNKFISILAHDLRSPFSSILGVLELVSENIETNNIKEIEKNIAIATNSANNTLSLLDNLLIWIISQRQGENFNPIKIDLYNLLLEQIEHHTISANQKQITLLDNIAHDLYITADLQMVKTIIRNLLTNAIKYTARCGTITISAIENNQYVEIGIEDNGIGISFEAQKELFKIDSFHSTAGTKKVRGTGLGLLICRDFVEKHGGKIWLESEPGKGSEFKFTLPHEI